MSKAVEKTARRILHRWGVRVLPGPWAVVLEWAKNRQRTTFARHLAYRYLLEVTDALWVEESLTPDDKAPAKA